MNRAVVFLNLDRVLARSGVGGMSHRPLFESWWRFREGVDVVVSSDLRRTQSLERISSCFQADVRKRVIGATPTLANCTRQREIDAWRTHNGHVGPFAALDDAAVEFERDWPHLVVVGRDGLTARDLVLVDHVLKQRPIDSGGPVRREGSWLGRFVGLGAWI